MFQVSAPHRIGPILILSRILCLQQAENGRSTARREVFRSCQFNKGGAGRMYKQGVDYAFGLGAVCEAPHRSRNSRRTYAFDSRRHIYSAPAGVMGQGEGSWMARCGSVAEKSLQTADMEAKSNVSGSFTYRWGEKEMQHGR